MSLILKNIPIDWQLKKLKDVAEFSNGKGHEQYIDENGKYIVVNSKFISTDGRVKKFSSQNLSPLNFGDITMVMSDIPNGKAIAKCFIIDEENRYTLNQRICSIKSNENCDNKFLYYVINRNSYYLAFDNGVSQTNFRKEEVLDCPVLFPPLPEQQKIAEILSTVDAKIEVIDQQITETQALKKGLMQRLLTKGIGHTEFKDSALGKIPKSWEVVNVDDFILDKKGAMKIGPFGSALKRDSMVVSGIKVYGQENIFVRDMSFGDRYITQEHYESLKSCELFAGDFIISMMGTIGKCMVVPTGIEKGIMDSHLLRLQLNLERINTDFLKHLFRSPIVLNQVNNLAVGGIMAGLSSKIVKDIKFILPTINEQKQFSEIFNSFDDKLEVLSEKKTHYQELKQGLMQQLLTGKIRIHFDKLNSVPSV